MKIEILEIARKEFRIAKEFYELEQPGHPNEKKSGVILSIDSLIKFFILFKRKLLLSWRLLIYTENRIIG